MLDVGFWELALIGVVTLLVVGPERLPKIARTAGLWVGRARRMLGSIKAEIDREIKAEELREILDKQAKAKPLQTIMDDISGETEKPAATPEQASGSISEHRPQPGSAVASGSPDRKPD